MSPRNDQPGRSAAEREQARRERAERRAAQRRREAEARGEPPPPVEPPPPYEVPPPEFREPAPQRPAPRPEAPPRQPAPAPQQSAPKQQPAPPPRPVAPQPPPPEPAADDAKFFTDAPLPRTEPTTREPAPLTPVPEAIPEPIPPPTPTEPAEPDTAVDGEGPLPAVRRRPRPELRAGVRAPSAPRGPNGGDGTPSRGRRRAPRWLLIALAVLLIVVLWLLYSLFQPFHGDGGAAVRVAIPRGSGVGEIADILEKRGVVSDSFFFQARATVEGARGDLKPGAYKLKKDMSYSAAIDALKKGPARNVVEITIPEGRSRAEVARQLSGTGLKGSYRAATKRSKLLDPATYGGRKATSLEGFLFPSTYEVKRHAQVTALVNRQLTQFKREFRKVNLSAAKKKNLTPYDVLTIASMVERETAVDKDRAKVASVIYNRLKRNEPLGIDATVRFATGNWSRPLTQSQLATSSPYNTRKLPGLPPGPIGSPGLKSIQAAAHPAKTNYLFYVVKPCGNGEHAFSTNLAQFNKDAARYEAQRKARGGSPESC